MPKIDFIRHAQSEFNIGIHKVDSDLSDNGKAQASKLSGEWDLVIVSTLSRCIQTLEFSNIKYKSIIYSDLCREFRNGSICDWKQGEEQNNESYEDLNKRINEFKDYLKLLSKEHSKILVISHACFMVHFMNLQRGIYNCELISYEF